MLICQNCNREFPAKIEIDGKIYNLLSRKFCTDCSPIGARNTRSYIVELKENESFCPRCGEIKDKSEFYARKNNGKPFSYCKKCQEKVKEIKMKEKIELIVEHFGGCCNDCKNFFPSVVFNFYFDGKIYKISGIRNMSFERAITDLRDYIMLCKNCCEIRKWEADK